MSRMCWWLVDFVSRMLEREERDAVRGDMAESGETGAQALRDVLGLVARRQAAPLLAFVAVIGPVGLLLSIVSRHMADRSAIYSWLYLNNWCTAYFTNATARMELAQYASRTLLDYTALVCWSWTGGVVLGSMSRRLVHVNGFLFFLVLLVSFLGEPQHFDNHRAVFGVTFYRVIFPVIVQAVLVVLPAAVGILQGVRIRELSRPRQIILRSFSVMALIALVTQSLPLWQVRSLVFVALAGPIGYMLATRNWRLRTLHVSAVLLALTFVARAADPPGARAERVPVDARKAAPDFVLQDAAGKTAKMKDYRGKVVLLDFWATWCTGCKKEIPWFSRFQETYGRKRFAVVGVSLDEGGWKVLKPFLAEHNVPYRMLLGNGAMAERYGIKTMPDTFLIDQKGRIAAAYMGSLVDQENIEANIKSLLANQ